MEIMRPLTLEEMEGVSGGFLPAIIGGLIAITTIIVEIIIHKSDPDPLKGFGKDND